MAEPTEWVPKTTSPRFPGWYEVRKPYMASATWVVPYRWKYDGMGHWEDDDGFVRVEPFEWRGLNEPTHAADCMVNTPPDQPSGPCNCYLSKEMT